LEVPLCIKKLPKECENKFKEELSKLTIHNTNDDIVRMISNFLTDFKGKFVPSLFIYCQSESLLAIKAKESAPWAKWGGNQGGCSLVWKSENKYVIWHECFHLLGADDCYDKNNPHIRKCDLPTCIMQYAPSYETVDGNEFLCNKLIKMLKEKYQKK
jgi:hypothetical protein